MTQEDVKDYLLENDCDVYDTRHKEDGDYYYMRKRGFKKIAVVYPLVKHESYTEAAVAHICRTLGVPCPEYAKSYVPIVESASKGAHIVGMNNNNGSPSQN